MCIFWYLYARSHFVFEMVNTEAAASGAQEGGRGLPYPFLETKKTVLVLQNRCSDLGKQCCLRTVMG